MQFPLADGRQQGELAGVLPRKVSFVGLNPQVAKANPNAHESHSSKEAGWPRSLELVDVPVPQPKSNEAVVKIAASGVNFIDVYHREGRYPVPLPFVIGQEGAGTVSAVGAEAKSVKMGDRVAWTSIMGSYAEYVAAPADRLVHIPQGVSDREAAA